MTHALCVFCGAMKFGVILPCSSCGQVPVRKTARAYAYIFSDWHIPVETLREYSRECIEEGLALPSLSPEQEAWAIETYAKSAPDDEAPAEADARP